jgi:HD-GYP domain-containing protein (c-di-GMP phosphodiesterase class II)/biotin operon repressor
MAMGPVGEEEVSVADVLLVLSLGADLGMGQPMEHVQREVVIAIRLAELLGMSPSDYRTIYYAGLVAWVGCHIDAYEQAKWFGDDLALKGDWRLVDMTPMTSRMFALQHLTKGLSPGEVLDRSARFARHGRRDARVMIENHWYAADQLARQMGLDESVRITVQQTFERWDGNGVPESAAGAAITPTARLINFADVVEVFHRAGGVDAAVTIARERSASQFDPDLVNLFCRHADAILSDLDDAVAHWRDIVRSDPEFSHALTGNSLDTALAALGDFVDIKSPYTLGHSEAVSSLAAATASELGLPESDAKTLRRAGWVHDLGRLGVSNSVWDAVGPLTEADREQIRIHPYLTERMLAYSNQLNDLGRLAAMHHERIDGSGYPRAMEGRAIPHSAQVLAVADAYISKLEPRPYRPASTKDEAMEHLRAEVKEGKMSGEIVDSVLVAAGHRIRRRPGSPGGLTPREIEVLRLLARGSTGPEIAEELAISKKTVGSHIEHIYAKIGVTNRARASLYAVSHGLMDH